MFYTFFHYFLNSLQNKNWQHYRFIGGTQKTQLFLRSFLASWMSSIIVIESEYFKKQKLKN